MRHLEIFFTLPFKILFVISGFIVWQILSNGEWKMRKRRGNSPLGYWQDQYQGAVRQNRENEKYFLRREEERDAQHHKEQKRKEREISYLRSKLYK
jgi:hypothetical protein